MVDIAASNLRPLARMTPTAFAPGPRVATAAPLTEGDAHARRTDDSGEDAEAAGARRAHEARLLQACAASARVASACAAQGARVGRPLAAVPPAAVALRRGEQLEAAQVRALQLVAAAGAGASAWAVGTYGGFALRWVGAHAPLCAALGVGLAAAGLAPRWLAPEAAGSGGPRIVVGDEAWAAQALADALVALQRSVPSAAPAAASEPHAARHGLLGGVPATWSTSVRAGARGILRALPTPAGKALGLPAASASPAAALAEARAALAAAAHTCDAQHTELVQARLELAAASEAGRRGADAMGPGAAPRRPSAASLRYTATAFAGVLALGASQALLFAPSWLLVGAALVIVRRHAGNAIAQVGRIERAHGTQLCVAGLVSVAMVGLVQPLLSPLGLALAVAATLFGLCAFVLPMLGGPAPAASEAQRQTQARRLTALAHGTTVRSAELRAEAMRLRARERTLLVRAAQLQADEAVWRAGGGDQGES